MRKNKLVSIPNSDSNIQTEQSNQQSEINPIYDNQTNSEVLQNKKQKYSGQGIVQFQKIVSRISTSSENQFLIAIFVIIVVLYYGMGFLMKAEPLAQYQTLTVFLRRALAQLEPVPKYLDVQKYQHSQLPICLIVSAQASQNNDLINASIKQNNYSNLHYSYLNFEQIFKSAQQSYHQNKEIDPAKLSNHQHQAPTYTQVLQQIKKDCPQKYPILTFVSRPLKPNSLSKINKYFQEYQAWMLYNDDSQTQQKQNIREIKQHKINHVEIISVYLRVFQFIQSNSQSISDRKILMDSFHPSFVTTSLFQMCKFNSLPIQTDDIFVKTETYPNLLSLKVEENQTDEPKYSRVPYQQVYNLYQNYHLLDQDILKKNHQSFLKGNKTITQKVLLFVRESKLSHRQAQYALQFEQLTYLPDNHTLNKVQIDLMDQKYEIKKYWNKELPLCININGRNNLQNERYKKNLDSVTSQNYKNYQIVFIDDFSDDRTLIQSKNYLQNQLKFDKSKATFIRNKVHKFATYNILNAGFNYCHNDSIQLTVDGDDMLIGKQVLQLINAQFQKKDLWVYYNQYINDKYQEGLSVPFQKSFLTGMFGTRKLIHFFGKLQAFRTSVLKHIPTYQHLDYFGNFLTTLYDTALQYPLFQLSGPDRVQYNGYFSYLYFSSYGTNDDSNIFKVIKRVFTHVYISFRRPLKQITNIDDFKINMEMKSIFQKEKGIFFQEIN